MTHMYLGSELFSYGPLIPAGIFALMKKYRQDFLYGNLMADSIIGKKYLPEDKSSHCWDVGLKILRHANREAEKAYVYGYLCHLAADTVAHEILTEDMRNVEHTWVEMKADSLIKKTYWLRSVTFSRAVQRRNDSFLESILDRFMFVSIGEVEENYIGSNCGQFLRRHLSNPECIQDGYTYQVQPANAI